VIGDILTVMRKERNALFVQPRSRYRLAMTFLVPLGLSIWMPWEAGPDWFQDFLPSLIISFALPLLLVGTMVPDSFAGERERKTLETLLASRLPDRAILFGKLTMAIAYGWVAAIVALVIGFVVANATHWTGEIGFYEPLVLLADLCLGFLISTLAASAGVLISLRAKSVQEAQQLLTTSIFLPPMIAGFVAWGVLGRVAGPPPSIDAGLVVAIGLAVIAALCVILVWLAVRRFRRDRLIAD
jgi:ABC-2 type transport system permease protein